MPRSLLPVFERFFDDAALFPPTSQTMADALVAYDRARHGPHQQVVGAFLCPLTRLDELDACVAGGVPGPAEVGVVGQGTASGWWRLGSRSDVAHLESGLDQRLPSDVLRGRRYLDVPARGEIEPVVERLAQSGAGARVRCGGPAPDLVPSSERLAQVLVACADRRVTLKAVGGTHRPFRSSGAPGGPEHGFVNLLAAAASAVAGNGVAQVAELLDQGEDEGPALLDRVDRHARLVVSVGCSSLDEAVGHLQALDVL